MIDYQPFQPTPSVGLPPMDMPPEQGISLEATQRAAPTMATPKPAARLEPRRLLEFYRSWEQAKEAETLEQHQASRYYHAKQWTDAEIKALKRRKQPITTKNRIKRKVDFLVGVEQRLRRDPKGYPRNPSGEQAAHIATACIRYVEDVNKWPNIASECASDALIRGIGIQWAGIEVIKGQPEVRKRQLPCDRFFYDPRSERWDFSDARFLGEHQWLDIDQAKELLPWAADDIEKIGTQSMGGAGSGALPQDFDKDKNWVDAYQRRIRLLSIWYKNEGHWLFDYLVGAVSLCPSEPKTETDPATGQQIITPPMDCISPYLNDDGETVHPYECWSPYVDERNDRYGVVRDMIPIQDEINKRSSKMLHQLTVRQTRGEKGAVEDVDRMKSEMAKPDGHVEYNKGFEFDVIDQSPQIQGQMELLQEAKAEIENLGPNPGLIGRGVEKQSGRAILAQQNSGMTELSPVFERMREWKLKCYRRDWNLMRQFWNNERYIRITANPQAIQFLTVNKVTTDPMTGQATIENSIADMDIDVLLDEGPDTVTMREELMQQLADLGPGAVPPELLIELSNINEKDAILKKMQEFKSPPPELQALQKRMADLEELLKSADVDKKQAEAEKTRADAITTYVGAGIDPAMAAQYFPVHYREPTYLQASEQMMAGGHGQNALAGPPPNGPPGLPPPNPMMPPDGDFLAASSTPWVPGDEPQINEPGGLPLPPPDSGQQLGP